jgi:putative ABC transport system substrate-binding protein
LLARREPFRDNRRMKRRHALQILGGTLVGGQAVAQPAARKRRIGLLFYIPNAAFERGFIQAMREVGFVEGENLEVVRRDGQESDERLDRMAQDLVRERVELIVVWSTNAAEAAKRATTTLPILVQVADPVGSGLIKSLARPEANITGISSNAFGISEKRVHLFIEALPAARRLGFLGLRGESNMNRFLEVSKGAASRAKATMELVEVADTRSIEAAIAAAKRADLEGLVLQQIFYPQNAEVAALTLKYRMPAISWQRTFTDAGGLMAYGATPEDNYQRTARMAVKLLSGIKPADLPVEQPTRTELTVNLRTARQLGLTLPPSFLGRADDVIE